MRLVTANSDRSHILPSHFEGYIKAERIARRFTFRVLRITLLKRK
jgi:hypothetical protein